jgi:hypothetical protein
MLRLIIGGYDPDKISRIGPCVSLSSPSWGHWLGSARILAALRKEVFNPVGHRFLASFTTASMRFRTCASSVFDFVRKRGGGAVSFLSALAVGSTPALGAAPAEGPLTGASARFRSHTRTNRWPRSPNRLLIPCLIVHWNQSSLAHCLLRTRRIRTSNL